MNVYTVSVFEIDPWHGGEVRYQFTHTYSSLGAICQDFKITCFNANNMSCRAIQKVLNEREKDTRYSVEEHNIK